MHELRHGPLPVRQLAERMHLQISTVTRLLDQLQKRNYIYREQSQEDRRVFYVGLTPSGKALVEKIAMTFADIFLAI